MKRWEFTNVVEIYVSAVDPQEWLDLEHAERCPPGWKLIIDAENEIVAMVPPDKVAPLVELMNTVEEKYPWEEPY